VADILSIARYKMTERLPSWWQGPGAARSQRILFPGRLGAPARRHCHQVRGGILIEKMIKGDSSARPTRAATMPKNPVGWERGRVMHAPPRGANPLEVVDPMHPSSGRKHAHFPRNNKTHHAT
jgi:hypothetical protein